MSFLWSGVSSELPEGPDNEGALLENAVSVLDGSAMVVVESKEDSDAAPS